MKKELKTAALATLMALTLFGCASNPDSASNLAADAKQSENIIKINDLKQAIDAADKQVTQSIKEELHWFATKDIEEANKALVEAKEYYAEFEFDPSKANSSSGFFSSINNIDAANESINTFNEYMTKATTLKSSVLSALSETFDYRTQLNYIDAQQYFPSTVQELESDLKKLVDQVANDKTAAAIAAQPSLVAKQRALEIKTVTAIYLSDAKSALDKLIKADTAKDAPKSISHASASLTAATAFIAADPRAIDEIQNKAKEVIFSINRAEQIALAVKKLKAIQPADYEDHLISYEKILLSISNTLGAEDRRDLAFDEQGKALVTFIEESLKDLEVSIQTQQQLRKELKDQKSYVALLEEKISTLNANLADVKQSLADSLAEKVAKTKQAAAEQGNKTADVETKSSALKETADTAAAE
ncbi:hypothetical protein EBI00_12755 [Marinomonas hwangdonensis]|uniref:DNA repair protein n=1 Tax=Marinomonas hwangdonensis TaxID=1053647 RepID=A0A3M8Q2R2_9GAMM|nr:hypothetical protein EBI00_12755 [Marinomonas hwangdonensis]